MTIDSEIEYHLKELEAARQSSCASGTTPELLDTDQVILDIGCGIGQTFVAAKKRSGKLLVGLDISLKPLVYGHHHFDYVAYVNGTAESLPFKMETFDLVLSRVSLPYTNIPRSLSDVNRVLKANGKVWFTLHPFSMTASHLIRSILNFKVKDVIYRSYVILNGMIFHTFGWQFAFIVNGRYESYQTRSGMRRAMKQAGFEDILIERRGKQFICTGRKLP